MSIQRSSNCPNAFLFLSSNFRDPQELKTTMNFYQLSTVAEISILVLACLLFVTAEECEDVPGKFNIKRNGDVQLRSCKQIRRRYPHQCNINANTKENCPLSCGQCGPYGNGPSCKDKEGKFEVNGKMKGCANAANNSNLCRKHLFRKYCPLTCGLCEPTFMNCPLEGLCCNGLGSNCALRVDEMLFATLHNANHHTLNSPWANHQAPLEQALEVGYRGLWLDVCKCLGQLVFCHSLCSVGRREPVTVFNNIISFLEKNPTELIVINFQMSKNRPLPSEVWSLMKTINGMEERTYVHDGGQWPTMGTLISEGKQIVAFYHNGPLCPGNTGCVPQIAEFFDYAKESEWELESVQEVMDVPQSCIPTRGVVGDKDFYSVNNFVTDFGPDPAASLILNEKLAVAKRLNDCENAVNSLPNFISIDFWQLGDVPLVTQVVNAERGLR